MSNEDRALQKVPEDKVGEVVQQYIEWDGATQVRCKKEDDGSWQVNAQ
jgi:hypothetical protein